MVASHFLRMPVRFTLSTVKLLCTMHLLQTHVFQLSATGGPSMLPSFSVAGDWISIDMTHARNRRRALRVGDIISYRLPYSPDGMGIKRLIGLPGDYVCHGTPGTRGEDHVTQVPEGHCWVVGDNLAASRDSRTFGPLPLALVTGKVIGRVLPLADRCWFENPLEAAPDGN